MKNLLKSITILALAFSLSIVYAQDEASRGKTRTRSNHQNERKSDGLTKDYKTISLITDGSGKNFVVFDAQYLEDNTISFGTQGVYEIADKPIIMKGPGKVKTGATAAGARGQPIKGVIVKGGKNPGASNIRLSQDPDGRYIIPNSWTKGSYWLSIEGFANSELSFTFDIDDEGSQNANINTSKSNVKD